MVTVNDLVRQRVIFPKLRFLLELAGAIILILDETLETQLAVGAKNQTAGKTPNIIQFITNFLADFAIRPSGGCDRFVPRIVEFVNHARAIRFHR